MKRRAMMLLAVMLLLAAAAAFAQETTYVFPYEGFRYTQKETETVLTQTNLAEHEELIASLGTTREAILASYMASGIVMEVIPQEGGQIAVSVADAGAFADVERMEEIDVERLQAFAAQFEESGMYESVGLTQTQPVCVRLTSSAMYASMPVYSLRYALLHLGRMYMITQTIVGRAPDSGDDARMEDVLSGMMRLSVVSDPTPAPTPVPTPTPEPTPVPTPGVADVIAGEGNMEVSGVPSYTNDPAITVTGVTDASAEVQVSVGDKFLGRTTARADGSFTIRVTLPGEGEQVMAVMTDTAEVMLALYYEMPAAKLIITGPQETTFTGDDILVRGETEPNATVYVTYGSDSTNVKASKNGDFSVRLYFNQEGPKTCSLRTKAAGFRESTAEITLTRELTEREQLSNFRKKAMAVTYDALTRDPQKYLHKPFTYRGRVMAFTDYDGRACALVCVDNAGVGVWYDPVWIVLSGEEELEVGNIATFYVTGEGLTLPAAGTYTKEGDTVEAPVVSAQFVLDIK